MPSLSSPFGSYWYLLWTCIHHGLCVREMVACCKPRQTWISNQTDKSCQGASQAKYVNLHRMLSRPWIFKITTECAGCDELQRLVAGDVCLNVRRGIALLRWTKKMYTLYIWQLLPDHSNAHVVDNCPNEWMKSNGISMHCHLGMNRVEYSIPKILILRFSKLIATGWVLSIEYSFWFNG